MVRVPVAVVFFVGVTQVQQETDRDVVYISDPYPRCNLIDVLPIKGPRRVRKIGQFGQVVGE